MSVRSIRKDELQELLKLYEHLLEKDYPLPDTSVILSVWEKILFDPLRHYFVIEYEKKIVSSCNLSIILNLTRGCRPYGLIENVVTHNDYRRRGFGKKVLQYALEVAWRNNCYKVMLLTGSKDSGVHRFYQEAGFLKGIKTGFIAKHPNFL